MSRMRSGRAAFFLADLPGKWRKHWPGSSGMDFCLGAELQFPDWLLQSEVKQTNLSPKRKHMWCGFMSYKGMHSLLANYFGDSIILNSPPIGPQYLCLEGRSCPGASKMTKDFKQLLSCGSSRQGRLPRWLLIVSHFKERGYYIFTCGPWGRAGDEEWCGCRLSWQTAPCLSHARHPLRTAHDLLSPKLRCPFISRRDVKGVTDEKGT